MSWQPIRGTAALEVRYETVLEYGEAYLEANDRIIEAMTKRMSPGAVALAYRMAEKAAQADVDDTAPDEVDEAA